MEKLMHHFQAELKDGHKGYAVEVPFNGETEWKVAASVIAYQNVRGIPVEVKMDDCPFQSLVINRWGKTFLLVPAEAAKQCAKKTGDKVDIRVKPQEK